MRAARSATAMSAEGSQRREFLAGLAGAAAVGAALPANAIIDYAGLPGLGGSDKIDINNANVRVYVKIQGMYPTVAGKIVSNGPYKSVADLYAIKGLSEPAKAVIKKNEARLYAGPPEAAYVIDRINNGLYR